MKNNFWNRKRAKETEAGGKIVIDHSQRLIVFRYKGEQYAYEYQSSASHGLAYIYEKPYHSDRACIYSSLDTSKCTPIGNEVFNAFMQQKGY
jgi:hypothetical protein